MMVVYVASPYTAARGELVHINVCTAMDAALHLRAIGHMPIVPHLSHYLHLRWCESGYDAPYEYWLATGKTLMRVCDAIVFVGKWTQSAGCKDELRWAKKIGLQIYRCLGDVPPASDGTRGEG